MSINLGVSQVVVGEDSPVLDPLEGKLTKAFEDLTFEDKTLDLFFKEKLLARAIEDDVSLEYSSLGSAGKEIEYLNSKEGLQHASSTLLVPEKPVHVYKIQGLLFSGETSKLEHISSVDSNSAVSNDGELIASHDPDTTMGSLEELSEAIKTTDILTRSRLNEVNGHFFMFDVGDGIVRRAENMGLPLNRLDGIFITHWHSDHFMDLASIVSRSWLLGRSNELHLYGPDGTDNINQSIKGYLHLENKHRFPFHVPTPIPVHQRFQTALPSPPRWAATIAHTVPPGSGIPPPGQKQKPVRQFHWPVSLQRHARTMHRCNHPAKRRQRHFPWSQ